jgi:hypothetical protein
MTAPALPAPAPNRARTRPILLLAVLGLAITSIGSGVFSLALFTSSATVGANTFTTGTITITTSPTTAALTAGNLMPGDTVTAPIQINNTGSAQLRYSVTAATTDPDTKGLRTQLTIAVKSGVTACTNAGWSASGTSVTTATVLGTTTLNVVGDPTTGSQSGDRTLASGANETLCFQVSLPLATGNAYQNATATTTLTFAAEQTANN